MRLTSVPVQMALTASKAISSSRSASRSSLRTWASRESGEGAPAAQISSRRRTMNWILCEPSAQNAEPLSPGFCASARKIACSAAASQRAMAWSRVRAQKASLPVAEFARSASSVKRMVRASRRSAVSSRTVRFRARMVRDGARAAVAASAWRAPSMRVRCWRCHSKASVVSAPVASVCRLAAKSPNEA